MILSFSYKLIKNTIQTLFANGESIKRNWVTTINRNFTSDWDTISRSIDAIKYEASNNLLFYVIQLALNGSTSLSGYKCYHKRFPIIFIKIIATQHTITSIEKPAAILSLFIYLSSPIP